MAIRRSGSPPNVVIVGGGFAGVAAAKKLAAEGAQVTVVDANDVQSAVTDLPNLVASGRDLSYGLSKIAAAKGFRFEQARVVSCDSAKKTVELQDGRQLGYDQLVIAAGAKAQKSLGHGVETGDGVFTLRTRNEALALRGEIERKLAERAGNGAPVQVAIAGAGLSGIELAAALASHYGRKLQISLMGPELGLPDPRDVAYARSKLERMGVRIREGVTVSDAKRDGLWISAQGQPGERVASDIVVATVGERGAADTFRKDDTEDAHGRLATLPTLQSVDDPNIFVVGDAANITDAHTGKPVPQTVRMAEEASKIAAGNILRRAKGRPMKEFSSSMPGWICSLGQRDAVGRVFGVSVRGARAVWLKERLTLTQADPIHLHDGWLKYVPFA